MRIIHALLLATLLAGCEGTRDLLHRGDLAWLTGRWRSTPVAAVTGRYWMLDVRSVGAGERPVDAAWYSGAERQPATVRVEGDQVRVLAANGEVAELRRVDEARLDGVVRAPDRDGEIPVTLERR